jgi:hypothetical protein
MSAEAVSRIGCRCDGVSIDAICPCPRLDDRRREAGYPLIAGVRRRPLLQYCICLSVSFAVRRQFT